MFTNRKLNNIQRLFFIAALVLLTGILAAGFFVQNQIKHTFYLNQQNTLLETVNHILPQFPIKELNNRNIPALKAFSRKIQRLTQLRMTIISPNGAILADSNIPASQLPKKDNQNISPDLREARKTGINIKVERLPLPRASQLTITRAIYKGDSLMGFARFRASLEKTERAYRQASRILWGVMLFFLGLSYLTGLFILRHFRKRITAFAGIAGELTKPSSFPMHPFPPEDLAGLGKQLNLLTEHFQNNLKRLNEELKSYQQMLASIREGILVIDPRRIIRYCNETAAQYLAIPQAEAIGKYDYQIIRNKHLTSLLDNFFHRPIVATDEVQLDENRYLEIFITPIEREPLRAKGALLLFRDITQSRQLERIRRDFVANVSHEFKTPLAAIRGYAESLLDWGLNEPDTSRKYVQKIIAQSQQLENLVTDLLQLARIERLQHIDLHPFSPFPIIEEVVQNYQEPARRTGITLHIRKEAPTVTIMGHPEMFRSIMVNLIDNAVKYTPSGGQIIIGLNPLDSHCEIFVKDTGMGIPGKELKRIFERFYRVDKARSRDISGTGLGLSIVKHLAELQNAQIDVTSSENEGSCFTVVFKKATA